MTESPSLDDYKQLFAASGGTDVPYLSHHFQRYCQTKERLLAHWDRGRGDQLLDIGAHWLHQSLLYAIDGFRVTALDLPVTLEIANVQALARSHAIHLLPNANLEHPTALATVPDDSFSVVLFTEVIEHITFNPVAMWREIYRVMKPGGRIIITTPNYYALRGRTWNWGRFLRRFGGGIETLDILRHNTYAHHWKEYSLRELIYYFCVLSPDFNCVDAAQIQEYQPGYLGKPAGKFVRWIEQSVPCTRPNLYLEVELMRKDRGIVVEPHW